MKHSFLFLITAEHQFGVQQPQHSSNKVRFFFLHMSTPGVGRQHVLARSSTDCIISLLIFHQTRDHRETKREWLNRIGKKLWDLAQHKVVTVWLHGRGEQTLNKKCWNTETKKGCFFFFCFLFPFLLVICIFWQHFYMWKRNEVILAGCFFSPHILFYSLSWAAAADSQTSRCWIFHPVSFPRSCSYLVFLTLSPPKPPHSPPLPLPAPPPPTSRSESQPRITAGLYCAASGPAGRRKKL